MFSSIDFTNIIINKLGLNLFPPCNKTLDLVEVFYPLHSILNFVLFSEMLKKDLSILCLV